MTDVGYVFDRKLLCRATNIFLPETFDLFIGLRFHASLRSEMKKQHSARTNTFLPPKYTKEKKQSDLDRMP
jgi:hypothetical protein